MTKANVNKIEIEYETFGDPSDKPLLLIMGLGDQLSSWDEGFIKSFTDRGFFVIIFDNRDVGLSTKCDEAGEPDLMGVMMAFQQGEPIKAPYLLDDMADDSVELLDVLGIKRAHICGVSVGGMIAQTIAYRHPSRVLSLTCIMSTTNNPELPQMTQETAVVFMSPVPPERDAQIENQIKVAKYIYGSGFTLDEKRLRTAVAKSFDRSFYPQGISRQMIAIMVQGNLKEKISVIKVPTLVIHGREDLLYPVKCGIEIAETIQGFKLIIIEGMGHSLPPEIFSQISKEVEINASKA
ncbi:hypothetical protein LCGC14_1333040 [marine sediment metagenome]|uniref:AB hydrolase-1 domain-containing protein n=1 Tax=marine sediment metagenome TaxID=412755 RepID=A0A0F9KGP6_9ZZZZ|nr:MAG: 3-oxoadipate enol-lactonase 2 [Candidatus Lokiarchaeum sp. GC14_75]